MKLNLPRLIEGMEDRLMTTGTGKPSLSPGMMITAEVALGQQGRANQSLVLTPFRCGDEQTLRPVSASVAPSAKPAEEIQNPLLRARAWERMLALDPKLSLRRLAAREGLVAPTLVQHFKLLKLAPEIQSFLATQRNPEVLRFLSLRRLMTLADLAASEQRRIFRVWQTESGVDLGLPAVASSPARRSVRAIRPG